MCYGHNQWYDISCATLYFLAHRFLRIIQFAYQICVMFDSTHLCKHLSQFTKGNKGFESSRCKQTNLSLI